MDAGAVAGVLCPYAAVHHDALGRQKIDDVVPRCRPLHEAEVCSQIEQVARFAATETPEPLLVPRGTRVVSYGLQACPPQAAVLQDCPEEVDFRLWQLRRDAGPPMLPRWRQRR